MKFQPNSFNSVQLTERTRNCIYLHVCYKGNNLKNTHARVMVLVHDTSSQCALQNVRSFVESYRADTILWRTERPTDRHKGKTICLPTLAGARHNEIYSAYKMLKCQQLLAF